MGTAMITTADRFSEEESTHNFILDSTKVGQLKDLQQIVAVSEYAKGRGLKPGGYVLLDFKKYMKSTQKKNSLQETMDEHYSSDVSFEVPMILLDGQEALFLDTNDVVIIVDEFEYLKEGEGLITGTEVNLN